MIPRSLSITVTALMAGLFVAASAPTHSHSGGTNADGCHTNSRTGDYHCHGSKQPDNDQVTYCHVINGERRCGYSRSSCSRLASRDGGYCQRE